MNLLDEGIDQYLGMRAVSGLIPKYYGHPVVIGAFSIITLTFEGMKCVARRS